MRKIFRTKRFEPETKTFRVNEKILAQELMVIDEEGQKIGVLSKEEALREARERELDLVEVSPKSVPPICKIMNYGSFKYQQEKTEKRQRHKSKTVEVKTIKLSLRISQHDLDFRVNQAADFLDDNDKVRVELQLRGRENQHSELARETIGKFIDGVRQKLPEKNLKLEQEIKKQGNRLSAIISF